MRTLNITRASTVAIWSRVSAAVSRPHLINARRRQSQNSHRKLREVASDLVVQISGEPPAPGKTFSTDCSETTVDTDLQPGG